MSYAATRNSIPQIVTRKKTGGRNQDHTQLDCREHDLPQRRFVAEHDQEVITTFHVMRAQPVRDLVGTSSERREGQATLCTRFLDNPQRRILVANSHRVEVIERPIELGDARPYEAFARAVVVHALSEKEVARLEERGCADHRDLLPFSLKKTAHPKV